MKLEKAIELTEQRIAYPHLPWNAEDFKALQLGIEAMYRCQEFRKYKTPGVYMPLPGETKD